jgi:hypothetical protein
MEKLKEILEAIINNSTGIKAIELACEIADFIHTNNYDSNQIQQSIEELLADEKICELEFIIPKLDYKIKSIYFPRGTKANLINLSPF